MRDICAYTGGYRSWTGSMEYAADLAARVDGCLTGLYVHPSPLYAALPYASGDLLETVIGNARDIQAKARNAADAFVAWAMANGVRRADWQVAEGAVPAVLAHIGNWHDVLVLERNAYVPWGAPADLGSLVLCSHLPCIVTPKEQRDARLDCVALAWNGSREAVRAIHSGLRLVRHASRVVLLQGRQRETEFEHGWQPRFDIDTYLDRHGVAVERVAIDASDDKAGEALLDAASRVDANLLVMGAYGRSRFSEWAFGGATRHVLAEARLPVLMRN